MKALSALVWWCLVAGPAAIFFSRAIMSSASSQTTAAVDSSETSYRLLGAGSCSAMPCHNANGPRGSMGSEYTTWILHDKHARAYEVLFEKRSRRMLQILDNRSEKTPVHPENDRRCLNCHVYPDLEKVPHKTQTIRQDGVSCEACHGPAEKWLTEHYAKRWQDLDVAEKEKWGMRDTKSLAGRALVCVACHVGRPGSDVNHDLIAAGHPPRKFEFGAYHANMPHHWNDAKDKDRRYDMSARDARGRKSGPDFEARAWATGQIVTAQAALRLLVHRAGKEDNPWPEFAEYDCFACHHSLQGKSWRQERYLVKERERGKRPLGSYSWGSWYFSMPRVLADMNGASGGLPALDELDREMSRPSPRRGQVARMAENAATEIQQRLRAAQQTLDNVASIRRRVSYLVNDKQRLGTTNWDTAAQLYLGLAALRTACKDMAGPDIPPSIGRHLQEMAGILRFPKGWQSPGTRFSVVDFQKELLSLRKDLTLP